LIQIQGRPGAASAAHYATITALWAAWSNAHDLNGLWTSLTIAESTDAERFRDVYPNGEPMLELVARGSRIYDPRTAATAWSDNAALVIADFLQGADGFGLAGYVDEPLLIAAADDCETSFALAASGTEPAYRIWGSYSLMDQPGDTLDRMLRACAGEVRLLPTGKIGITVGKNRVPTVTLARSELISVDSWTNGPDMLDRYTEAAFKYVDRGLGFQPNTGGMWIDAARETANGEAATGPEFDYTMAPSSTQGDRLIQQQIERDNPVYIISTRWKPSARRAIYEDVIALNVAELPEAVWRVIGYSREFGSGIVTLNLQSYAHPTWSNTREGVPQALPTPDVAQDVPVPTGIVAAGAGIRGEQNTFVATISAQWNARPSQALSIKIEYSDANANIWQSWPVGANETSTQIAPLNDGALYDLRFWYQTAGGKKSAYVLVEDVTALADAAAPASPTGMAVTNQTGGNALVQFTTSVAAGLWKTEVRRGATLIATSFAAP